MCGGKGVVGEFAPPPFFFFFPRQYLVHWKRGGGWSVGWLVGDKTLIGRTNLHQAAAGPKRNWDLLLFCDFIPMYQICADHFARIKQNEKVLKFFKGSNRPLNNSGYFLHFSVPPKNAAISLFCRGQSREVHFSDWLSNLSLFRRGDFGLAHIVVAAALAVVCRRHRGKLKAYFAFSTRESKRKCKKDQLCEERLVFTSFLKDFFVEFSIFTLCISCLFCKTFCFCLNIYADRQEKGFHHIMHPRNCPFPLNEGKEGINLFLPILSSSGCVWVCLFFKPQDRSQVPSPQRERTQQMSRPEPEEERRICEIEKTRLEMQTQIMFKKFLV